MKTSKKGLRWFLFNIFGPPELKNLVNHIDEILEEHPNITVYPMGEFPFSIKTSEEDNSKPIIFPTPQERTSYLLGFKHGVEIVGGSGQILTREQFDEMNKMEKRATHNDQKTRLN